MCSEYIKGGTPFEEGLYLSGSALNRGERAEPYIYRREYSVNMIKKFITDREDI